MEEQILHGPLVPILRALQQDGDIADSLIVSVNHFEHAPELSVAMRISGMRTATDGV
ncbi:hypothetical protein NKH77_09560 [Streptomyces sp. M19]